MRKIVRPPLHKFSTVKYQAIFILQENLNLLPFVLIWAVILQETYQIYLVL